MTVRIEEPRGADEAAGARAQAATFLLRFVALFGFVGAAGAAGALIFDPTDWGRGNWIGTGMLAALLLTGTGALWGIRRLGPRAGAGEPVSARTRRAEALFALSGLVAVPAMLALVFGTFRRDDPFALFSSGAIPPALALAAMAGWLLATATAWLWHLHADEHERRANAFGGLAGAGLFAAVAPAWWIAARGGLAPAPDVMPLWCAFMLVWAIGWFWRRYR